ncbi:cell envelope integrity protein TolA [Brumicola pallidula]|jgi:colicin import membrane protein|uniref:Colicin import membrane protein n=1 Tax=Brumicola pallidula DSM 14239 = ACAM 615 TaxID=1121922 RepID=K6Y6J2_9ALTE|nr:cell envelope integrity protein TolA [Glaciecola pallidula]GAC28399.1 colicin import membrane protein [Glaciecola pallidula DSM 14239 = ACAM 615]
MSAQNQPKPSDTKEKKSLTLQQKSFLISGAGHLFIVLSLLVSFKFSAAPVDLATGDKDTQAPNIIEATFIDSNVIEQNKREKQQSEAEAKRKQDQEAANKRKEVERKRQESDTADKVKRKKAADAKKQKEEQLSKERELQQKARLAQEKAQKQEIEKARQDKADQERAVRDNAMQEKMQLEQADRNERRQRQILSELQIANSKIKARIEQNLIQTGSIVGKSCRLRLRIASNGLVLDAVGTGDESLCLALRTAAMKAGTLPMPSNKDVNEKLRDTTLVYEN